MRKEIMDILSAFESVRRDSVCTVDWVLETIRIGSKDRFYNLSDCRIIDSMSDAELRENITEWLNTNE